MTTDSDFVGAVLKTAELVLTSPAGFGVAIGLIQVAMVLLRPQLEEKPGLWKLLTVFGLSVLVEALRALALGHGLVELLHDAAFLGAVQLAFHQLLKQLEKWRDEKDTVQIDERPGRRLQ